MLNIDYENLLKEVLNGRKNPFKNNKEYHDLIQNITKDTFYGCSVNSLNQYTDEEKRSAIINNIKIAIELYIDEKQYRDKNTDINISFDSDISF